jgi:hypothetical protein
MDVGSLFPDAEGSKYCLVLSLIVGALSHNVFELSKAEIKHAY